MIYNVSGTETSTSSEVVEGYRGDLVVSVVETSTSVETAADDSTTSERDVGIQYEIGCATAVYHLSGSEESESHESAILLAGSPYFPPDGDLGHQPGYGFRRVLRLYGHDLSGSLESNRLWRNGYEITVILDCNPPVYVFYNALNEEMYNLLNEDDYNAMLE